MNLEIKKVKNPNQEMCRDKKCTKPYEYQIKCLYKKLFDFNTYRCQEHTYGLKEGEKEFSEAYQEYLSYLVGETQPKTLEEYEKDKTNET